MTMRALRSWTADAEPWYAANGLANLVMGTSSVLVPLMIAQVLRESVAELGVLSSIVSLVGVVGSLIWGRLSDAAAHRKPFMVAGFAGVSLGFAGIAFAPSFTVLLVLNMVLNFFWVANATVNVLITIENQEQHHWERRIGHLNQVGALGWVAGLLFGSIALAVAGRFIAETLAIRILFGILALGAAGASVLAARLVPHVAPRFTQRRFRGSILALGNFLVERARFGPQHLYHLLRPSRLPALLWGSGGLRKGTKRFLLATLLAFTAIGFFGVPLPLLLAQRFAFPSSTVFLYFVVLNTGVVLAYPFASRRIKRLGNRSVQMGALGARLFLFLAAAVFLSISSAVPPTWILILYFLGIGVTWSFFQLSGVALASRLARPENRGQTLGLYNAIAGMGTIFAGVGSGFLAARIGYQVTFMAAAVLLVVALLVLHWLPAPEDAQRDEAPASRSKRPQERGTVVRDGSPQPKAASS
jgi:MFS family permease